MEPEFLAPGVKDGGEAGLCGKALPTRSQFDAPLGGGLEQEVIQELAVSKDQWVEFVRQGDDHMEVGGGQELLGAFEEPAHLLEALTLGAVTVTTRVEAETFVSATVPTGLQMASEAGRSAMEDVTDDLSLLRTYRMVLHVGVGMGVKDVGQLWGGFLRRRQPLAGDYFFGLHGLPPFFWRLCNASQGPWIVFR